MYPHAERVLRGFGRVRLPDSCRSLRHLRDNNDGTPAVGRAAITNSAQSFMTAFPDIVVKMERLVVQGAKTEYHWTLTGTNTGPGGTGKFVKISGFEEWRFGPDGLIAESLGQFDATDYERQLNAGGQKP